ncbi:hypothetical protein SAMN00120144_0866 [Hymenobacter roseosalivarius DSM 11622]|uniref:DUF1648 domain-containing protein n=1 Tax=Hymenobacter roseosalivarius DSM 11622 TaxID=645990 RepID=A0A1W1V6W4_9BACT|nr:hypothetical protein SAMN00120144_0866 [Hymenobacter roseosalivarius DSM 11622]
MKTLRQPVQPTGKKVLLLTLLLLPIGCLLWKWSTLPAQVPLHFSRGGADSYGDKRALIGLVLVPLIVYIALPFINRVKAGNTERSQIGTGVAVFLSVILCALLVVRMPAR